MIIVIAGVTTVGGGDEMKAFGGMGGLFLPQIHLLSVKHLSTQYAPSPNPFWRENNRFIYTWGGTPLVR